MRARGDMDETDRETGRRVGFGRRRVAPRVGIFDRKPYVRIFLTETFEDLGFVARVLGAARRDCFRR